MNTQARKDQHLQICLEKDIQFHRQTNGLDRYRFDHYCLPEIDFDEVNLKTTFLGKQLSAPLLISSMTGGTPKAKKINYQLAEFAQAHQLAMGVGSQRVVVEKPEVADTFRVRSLAPDILLFANLGAVQLNYTYGVEECQRAVDILEADALILHLNPLQECIQSNGDRNFKGLLAKIAHVCDKLPVPVIVKEVGNGISGKMAQTLAEVGVSVVDVAGAGGTSWSKVESERASNSVQQQLGQTFGDWGLPTAECLLQIRSILPEIPLIASGGLRNGLEVAKVIALGADLAGLALPFLQAADQSPEALSQLIDCLKAELTTALFCTGAANLSQLREDNRLLKI